MAQKSSEPMRVDSDVMDYLRALQNMTRAKVGIKPGYSLVIRAALNYTEQSTLVDALADLCRPPSNEAIRSAISRSKKRFTKARA